MIRKPTFRAATALHLLCLAGTALPLVATATPAAAEVAVAELQAWDGIWRSTAGQEMWLDIDTGVGAGELKAAVWRKRDDTLSNTGSIAFDLPESSSSKLIGKMSLAGAGSFPAVVMAPDGNGLLMHLSTTTDGGARQPIYFRRVAQVGQSTGKLTERQVEERLKGLWKTPFGNLLIEATYGGDPNRDLITGKVFRADGTTVRYLLGLHYYDGGPGSEAAAFSWHTPTDNSGRSGLKIALSPDGTTLMAVDTGPDPLAGLRNWSATRAAAEQQPAPARAPAWAKALAARPAYAEGDQFVLTATGTAADRLSVRLERPAPHPRFTTVVWTGTLAISADGASAQGVVRSDEPDAFMLRVRPNPKGTGYWIDPIASASKYLHNQVYSLAHRAETPAPAPTPTPPTAEPAPSPSPPVAQPPAPTPPIVQRPSAPVAGTVQAGVFHQLERFDVRVDEVRAARDGKVHLFMTVANKSGGARSIGQGTFTAVMSDVDGVGILTETVWRADGDEPKTFDVPPTVQPGGEFKVRYVLQPSAVHGPLARIGVRESDKKVLFFDARAGDPGSEASAPPPPGGGAFKSLSKLDVRIDRAGPARDGRFETFLTLRNPTRSPQSASAAAVRLTGTNSDGSPVTARYALYSARGERGENDALPVPVYVEAGGEMRVRYVFDDASNGALTVTDGTVTQTFTPRG